MCVWYPHFCRPSRVLLDVCLASHRSGDVELVHHFELVVHLDATLDQVQLTELKVTEVELQDLTLLGVGQDFRLGGQGRQGERNRSP